MGWLLVLLAAVAEVAGAAGLKLYSQQRNFRYGMLYIGGFGASFVFLYSSFRFLQLSIAYIVWVGIGTAGAVLINMYLLGESKNIGRMISVGVIIVGVIGLKVFS
ncbi:DMT family transporter [Neobacillus kokaensis]|uniref:QacE family quaternary ammonium compound efflux SMR transporter n=1 Tax=Neobacillus kokaensis TaxID=2759023 RepID=A0ABQ3NCL8_9BACI|nr:SMR family transporter [Neobacillus kokaensis]GHI01616.1 QacE family quaternary ammonium compound efflux SMR transporter [Neobacillus kokaensis]